MRQARASKKYPMISILGLGPGAIDDLSLRAWEKIQGTAKLYLRTARHPSVADLPAAVNVVSFDEIYQQHEQFKDVYDEIAARILHQAQETGGVVYAVPGDPLVGESTTPRILALAAEASIAVEIIHGVSFIEPCLSLLGIDALDGLQALDALSVAEQYHPPINPALPALLAQVYNQSVASNLKLTLMNQYDDDFPVKLIHAAGTSYATVEDLKLYEIDRSQRINVMTTLFVPAMNAHSSFETLQNIIAHLRSPEGCPWDREQSHKSLRPFLIEEAYEALEALDGENPKALNEELGDLLLQILLHTQIAIDDGEFKMADLLRQLNEKMIRRHPHVFGDVEATGDLGELSRIWHEVKQAEKAGSAAPAESLLDGIPAGAPALFVAQRYSQRASKVGFDWADIGGVEAKFEEELAEVLTAETDAERIKEIGDLIFVLVNWLRWLGIDDPESLLRTINAKFYRRFCHVEQQVAQSGKHFDDCSLDELEALWQEAKRLTD
ncbi:MAG: nucleoside triphosphate pyrophosphohydrolase [Chloroflexota bacterium]|nr:nucleoside triphosphate pyrophosphohydrolase [Chloroflexota bacterium]MDE2909342.1 nucleoside triphosphate pyrophosphohydrolase [Chloroflexota bacterium]